MTDDVYATMISECYQHSQYSYCMLTLLLLLGQLENYETEYTMKLITLTPLRDGRHLTPPCTQSINTL